MSSIFDNQPIDWEEYCSIKRMNPSTIVAGFKSMKRLKAAIDGGFVEETDAMRLGTGIHALLLEPEHFESRFCVLPDFEQDPQNMRAAKRKDEPEEDRRTNSKATAFYKKKVSEFARENADRIILKRDQYDSALYCIESIRSRPYMAKVIDSCEKEVTLIGEIEGVPFKGRVDLLREKRPLIVDLKTTGNCEKHAFGRISANLHYDVKLSIYRELVRQKIGKVPDVAVITQEPSGDFDNAYVPVPSIVLDNAYSRFLVVLAKYIKARNENVWPGVDGGKDRYEWVQPQWAMEDADEELVDWSTVPTQSVEPEESYF